MALREYESNHNQQPPSVHEPMMPYYNEGSIQFRINDLNVIIIIHIFVIYITGPQSSELHKQQDINALLSRYLEGEEEPSMPYGSDFDDGQQYLEERKRSAFRERGGLYTIGIWNYFVNVVWSYLFLNYCV